MDEKIVEELRSVHPALVMSQILQQGSTRTRIDVYVKNAVALKLRPIKGTGTLTAPRGSDNETVLRDFATFGSPLHLPSGSYSGSLDAPGGLDGSICEAAIVIKPAGDTSPRHKEVRFVVHDEDDAQVAAVPLHREYTTWGLPRKDGSPPGIESMLRDASGILSIRSRSRPPNLSPELTFTFYPPCGKRPREVLSATEVVAGLKPPNTITFAPAFGPIPSNPRHPLPEEAVIEEARLWRDLVQALVLVQEHTSTPLLVPAAEELQGDLANQILLVGILLTAGTAQIEASYLLTKIIEGQDAPEAEYRQLLLPLTIDLPEEIVTCGVMAVQFAVRRRGGCSHT